MPDDPIRHHGPSSIAALQTDDADFEDGPWTVHGIALGEDDVTVGVSGQRVRWPREALEDAAEALVGKKLTDGRNHENLESGQPPTRAIVGEVTEAVYDPGVGIVYRGEVDDPEIARLIARNRVDVSPVVGFEAREGEDGEGLVAESIAGFRDLAVVAEGAAPSNDISPGSGPLAAAAAAGLSAAFAEAGAPANDDPAGASSSGRDGGPETDPDSGDNDTTPTAAMELSDKEEELVAASRQLDDPKVIEAAAADRLDENEALIDAAAETDTPLVVDETEHEALETRVGHVEEMLDEALIDSRGLKEATVEAMSFEAKAAEFEADDGDGLELDALTQNPETGGSPETPDDPDEFDVDALQTDVDADSREEAIEALRGKHELYDSRGWGMAQQVAEDLETLGEEVN